MVMRDLHIVMSDLLPGRVLKVNPFLDDDFDVMREHLPGRLLEINSFRCDERSFT